MAVTQLHLISVLPLRSVLNNVRIQCSVDKTGEHICKAQNKREVSLLLECSVISLH